MSGFLGRWSRRKLGEEAPEPEAAPPAPRPAPAPPEPAFDPDSLPALDSLGAGSDLSAFLHPKVPALLRQAALRRVWAADPGIRDFMGPADYAWDFNAPDGVPGFALNLGGDIQKLLAQAIGEVTAPEREPEPAAPLLSEPDPVRMVEAAPPEVVEVEAAPEPLPARTRRHGGAVPVVEVGQGGAAPLDPPLGRQCRPRPRHQEEWGLIARRDRSSPVELKQEKAAGAEPRRP